VEGIVPGDGGCDDTERLVYDAVLLVHHEEVRWTARWEEGFFTMVQSPFQFLCCNEDLAETSVHFSFARVETACSNDIILVIKNVFQKCSEDLSALGEGCLGPFALGCLGCAYSSVNIVDCCRLCAISKDSTVGRTIAHNQLIIPFLQSPTISYPAWYDKGVLSSIRVNTHPSNLIFQYLLLFSLNILPFDSGGGIPHLLR